MTPPPALSAARRPAAARGYTVIEVLMAMTVLAIGGAGVITMQKTSVVANLDARKTDVANAIARTWVERLRQDAMTWTTPTPTVTTTNFSGTKYLQNLGTGGSTGWFVPATTISPSDSTAVMSAGFDILGRDLPASDVANASFCVNVDLTWLSTASGAPGGDMIRADVRVLWPVGISVGPPAGFCTTANTAALPDPNSANAPALTYHAIYVTTNLVENTSQ